MVRQTDRKRGVFHSLDWWVIAIYISLLVCGWFSVCGASYTYGDTNLFDFSARSGMQIIWIGTSIVLGFVLLMLDDRIYDTFAYVIYAALLLLLFVTIFNPHEIKGSRSWLVLGPLRLQPAEFAKFATALAAAKLMNTYGFNIHRWKDFGVACAVVLLPMLFIVGQKETGSALVYLSFFLMFYREGMSGSILFTGVAMVLYFVIGVRYDAISLGETSTSVGKFVVLLLVQIFSSGMVRIFVNNPKTALIICGGSIGTTLAAVLFSMYVLPFDVVWVQLGTITVIVCYMIYNWLWASMRTYLYIAVFTVGSVAFFYSADYILDNIMGDHQRNRIYVLLGLVDDIKGVGYNVHQSEIAIGSGGLYGKGFLNGTQTKLNYVPEQDTDFIFCTVGEEEGFFGCAFVLSLFLALILRLIVLAERQTMRFGRVYGYCVLSIFLFHVTINVGMVIGIMPVIGIPLPFFSYGGSSLWGFTILLFIFLRIDAGRNLLKR